MCKNCVVFCTFSVFILLKYLRVVDWGGMSPSSPPPWLRPWDWQPRTTISIWEHCTPNFVGLQLPLLSTPIGCSFFIFQTLPCMVNKDVSVCGGCQGPFDCHHYFYAVWQPSVLRFFLSRQPTPRVTVNQPTAVIKPFEPSFFTYLMLINHAMLTE